MTDTIDPNKDKTRTIVLLYGLLESGSPFWVFAAVRPSKYQTFLTQQKAGEVDLYHFEEFGEIIVSAEGKHPPDAVTIKVAEMYQTDPSSFLKTAPEVAREDEAAS